MGKIAILKHDFCGEFEHGLDERGWIFFLGPTEPPRGESMVRVAAQLLEGERTLSLPLRCLFRCPVWATAQ